MFRVPINYPAILVCGIAYMAIGFLWYGPLFGEKWRKLVGMTGEKKVGADKDMSKIHLVSFVSSLLMAYTLAHFIWFTAPGSVTIGIGVKTALWSFIGFIFPIKLVHYLYAVEKKSITLLVFDSGYFFVSLLTMGVILTAWM